MGTRGLTPEKENNVKAQEFPQALPQERRGTAEKNKSAPTGGRERGSLESLESE